MNVSVKPAVELRPFGGTKRDYEALAAISNAISQDLTATAEGLKASDRRQDPNRLLQRLVAEIAGKTVGHGAYRQMGWSPTPEGIFIDVGVHPDHQGRGVGGAIYDHLTEALGRHGPRFLWADAREDCRRAVRFLSARGFEPTMRTVVSRLDVLGFDAGSFRAGQRTDPGSDVEVCSLDRLMKPVSDWRNRCWDLLWELRQDMPHALEPSRQPFDSFIKMFKSPEFTPGAWFIARDGDDWVGISNIWPDRADATLFHTGVTGVVRSHRRRGIATDLKLRAIEFVRAQGGEIIDTSNEESNPMLDLNRALGFKPNPAWISFQKA